MTANSVALGGIQLGGLKGRSHDSGGRNRTLALSFGLASGFFIPIGNQLYLNEVVCLAFGPALLLGDGRRSRSLRLVAVASLIWAAGIAIGWLYVDQPLGAVIPLLSAAFVFYLSVCMTLRICSSHASFGYLGLGMGVGYLGAAFIQPAYYFAEAPWKFGLGIPITLIAMVIASTTGSRVTKVAVIVAAAGANIAGDYRSLALISGAVLAAELLSPKVTTSLTTGRRVTFAAKILASVGVVGVAVSQVYAQLASAGSLGDQARYRLELQGGGNPIYMLLAGRYELFFSLPAALRSPLLGLGPDPQATMAQLAESEQRVREAGLTLVADSFSSTGNIPTHSAIMSMWLTAGVLGLLAAVAVTSLVALLVANSVSIGRFRVLAMFLGLLTLWNLTFSPFGGTTRYLTAATVAWAVFTISNRETSGKLHENGESRG